jgi:hypothetical protein
VATYRGQVGTRASRRCWLAVILTASNAMLAGRQQPGTAGTAVFRWWNTGVPPVPACGHPDRTTCNAGKKKPRRPGGAGRRGRLVWFGLPEKGG